MGSVVIYNKFPCVVHCHACYQLVHNNIILYIHTTDTDKHVHIHLSTYNILVQYEIIVHTSFVHNYNTTPQTHERANGCTKLPTLRYVIQFVNANC